MHDLIYRVKPFGSINNINCRIWFTQSKTVWEKGCGVLNDFIFYNCKASVNVLPVLLLIKMLTTKWEEKTLNKHDET